MSGHNKWSTIKRKKGAADAKRGQLFTRITREIVIAAREGGGDADANMRLRIAVDKAKGQNMPKENIERAIKRGSGDDKEGVNYEEIYYEGYGPHGIALMMECVTENRNRTVAEIRHTLSRSGGGMGEAGSVAWQFKKAAVFEISADSVDFDRVFELAVDGGADDVTEDGDTFYITAPIESFKILNTKLNEAKIIIEDAGLRMLPNQEIELSVGDTLQVLKTIEALEDMDDIQNVFHNLKVSDEAMAALEED